MPLKNSSWILSFPSRSAAAVLGLYAVCFTGLSTEAAVLIGSMAESSVDNFDLTTRNNAEDTTVVDWAVWGQGTSTTLSPTTSKLGGSAISDLTDINPYDIALRGLGQFGDLGQTTFQWTDGTPTASASSVIAGIQHNANGGTVTGTGFETTFSGDAGVYYTVDIWFGSHRGTTQISASLNGAETLVYDLVAGEVIYNKFGWATYTFMLDSSEDVLTISTILTVNTSPTATGNAYFFAASLATDSHYSITPEPGTVSLMCGGLGLLLVCRKRLHAGARIKSL